jgi:hypothetical protein
MNYSDLLVALAGEVSRHDGLSIVSETIFTIVFQKMKDGTDFEVCKIAKRNEAEKIDDEVVQELYRLIRTRRGIGIAKSNLDPKPKKPKQ